MDSRRGSVVSVYVDADEVRLGLLFAVRSGQRAMHAADLDNAPRAGRDQGQHVHVDGGVGRGLAHHLEGCVFHFGLAPVLQGVVGLQAQRGDLRAALGDAEAAVGGGHELVDMRQALAAQHEVADQEVGADRIHQRPQARHCLGGHADQVLLQIAIPVVVLRVKPQRRADHQTAVRPQRFEQGLEQLLGGGRVQVFDHIEQAQHVILAQGFERDVLRQAVPHMAVPALTEQLHIAAGLVKAVDPVHLPVLQGRIGLDHPGQTADAEADVQHGARRAVVGKGELEDVLGRRRAAAKDMVGGRDVGNDLVVLDDGVQHGGGLSKDVHQSVSSSSWVFSFSRTRNW